MVPYGEAWHPLCALPLHELRRQKVSATNKETPTMRRKILPFILGGALSIAALGPAAAAEHTECTVDRGGAAGLVAAVVQANVCDVHVLNNSLNNLLRNADIRALNNILNNSPILSGNDVIDDITIEDNVITVSLLSGPVLVFQ